MPTFEITAPDGSQHEVTGPDGATQEQALERFKSQWQGGQQKPTAPVPSPKPQEPQQDKLVTAAKGAVGGAAGALAMPWALIGGGALVTATAPFTGVGAVAGPAMMTVGSEMLAAQTVSVGAALATVAGGAALGAVSAPAGQAAQEAAQALGMKPATAGAVGAVVELATGAVAGGVAGMAKGLALEAVPSMFRPVLKAYHALTEIGGEAVQSVSGAVAKARTMLADPALKDQPQHILHTTLQTAAEAHSKAADAAATKLEQTAQAQAQQLLQQGQQRALQVTSAGMAEEARARAAGGQTAAELRAAGKAKGDAAKSLHEQQAAKIESEHKAQAQAVLDKAHTEAAALRAEAAKRQEVLNKASEGKAKTAAAVQKLAAPKLLAVGEPKTPSAIGEPLQKTISEQKTAADAVRKQTDEKLRQVRDEVVAQKEQAGEFVDQTPEYKGLRAKIAAKIQNTVAGRRASTITTAGGQEVGLTRTGDPGVESGWQRVWNAINSKTVTWTDAEGKEQSQTFRTTHEALDNVRRKLGDAAYGKEAEGYGALGQKQAKELYEDIAAVQEAYAGEAQKNLQANYVKQLEEGEKFKTRTGRLALDEDKTPAAIPKSFFKDRDGVRDLKELTGNEEQVNRAGADFLSGKLQGKSAAQVKAYLDDVNNQDWLQELPGVHAKAVAYQKELQSAEELLARRTQVSEKLTKRAEGLTKSGGQAVSAADKAARKVVGVATGEAKQLEKAGTGAAKKVLGEGGKAASLEQRMAENAAKAAEAQAKRQAAEVGAKTKVEARAAAAEPKPAAGKLQAEAGARAKALRQEAQARVRDMKEKGTPVESVEHMINHEQDLQKIIEVGKVLHGVAGGKQQWVDAVGRVVSKKSPAALDNWWETRGRDVAKAGGATGQQIAELDAGVQAVLRAATPKLAEQMKKKLGLTMARALGAVMGAGVSAKLPGGEDE